MKKTFAVPLACTLLLALALALGATAALAQSQAPAAPPAPIAPAGEPSLCAPPAPASGEEPAPFLGLGVPEPAWRGCRIFCDTSRCSNSNQCTAAPGGVCIPVCNSGCCSYP